jgi:hypothetical protein
MDFETAVKAHFDWKRKLRAYLAKPDQSLRPAEVSAPDHCELGRWMVGEGQQKFGALPDFATLTHEHAQFHVIAGELVRKADRGDRVDSEVALCATSEFSKSTARVIAAIGAIIGKK